MGLQIQGSGWVCFTLTCSNWEKGNLRTHNWVDPHRRQRICGGPASLMGELEQDWDKFGDRGEAGTCWGSPPLQGDPKQHWTFSSGSSYLCVRGGGKPKWWVTNCPDAGGSQLEGPNSLQQTWSSEEGPPWLGGLGRERKGKGADKGIEGTCFLLSASGLWETPL